MLSDSGIIRRNNGRKYFYYASAVAIVYLLLVQALYSFEPFSPTINNILSNLVTVLVSLAAAIIATYVFRRYDEKEMPRQVWSYFSIALWLWVVGESIWAYYSLRYGEVGVTTADLFWVTAEFLLFGALNLQYKIVFRSDKSEMIYRYGLWFILSALLVGLFGQILSVNTGESWDLTLLVSAFYPAVELVIGVAALRLAYRFRGAALAYPWLGLFIFAFSDMLYAWLDLSGLYAWSADQGGTLTTIADLSYIGAYLVIALGCYTQLLLLRYGPIFNASRKKR